MLNYMYVFGKQFRKSVIDSLILDSCSVANILIISSSEIETSNCSKLFQMTRILPFLPLLMMCKVVKTEAISDEAQT